MNFFVSVITDFEFTWNKRTCLCFYRNWDHVEAGTLLFP